MMRFMISILLALSPGLASAAGELRHKPVQSMSEEDVLRLIQNPPDLSSARLPAGYKIGRCLLVVERKTRISGKCAYRIDKGGGFVINGPKQVYDGIDYPNARGSIALMVSTDYWATVFRDDDGTWNGYGNQDISGVKGEGPDFGPFRRDGACFLNEKVRVCLWKK